MILLQNKKCHIPVDVCYLTYAVFSEAIFFKFQAILIVSIINVGKKHTIIIYGMVRKSYQSKPFFLSFCNFKNFNLYMQRI